MEDYNLVSSIFTALVTVVVRARVRNGALLKVTARGYDKGLEHG